MLPPFLGQLMVVGTVGFVLLMLAVALLGRSRAKPSLVRGSLLAGASVAAVYAVFWILGLALARRTVLPPGESVSFCGLDCHLHVSVAQVRTAPYMGVTVRFASNAERAPEWPAELRFRLRDSLGREFAPTNTVPDNPLQAGASMDYELRFPAPAAPEGSVLIVTWDRLVDLLVPGAGNPLVQRQQRLALPPTTGA